MGIVLKGESRERYPSIEGYLVYQVQSYVALTLGIIIENKDLIVNVINIERHVRYSFAEYGTFSNKIVLFFMHF